MVAFHHVRIVQILRNRLILVQCKGLGLVAINPV